MEPGKTSFFQALGVPTKIARGTIEITSDLKLVEANTKVGPSEATLLNMLNISPFTYGMGITQIYDEGQTFEPFVLDIGDEQLLQSFASAITTLASISLAINFPTVPSVVHSFFNSYKNVLAVAIETEYGWPEIEELKDRIANPDAYAAAAPQAAAGGAEEEKKEEKKEEEEEESEDEGGFGDLLYETSPSPRVFLGPAFTDSHLPVAKCDDMSFVLFRRLYGLWSGFTTRCKPLRLLHRCLLVNQVYAFDDPTFLNPRIRLLKTVTCVCVCDT